MWKRAFTLIELLVVVAITAILAALLFPAFARARERARMTQCISNIRQLGLCVYIYAQDNDERYPIGWDYYRVRQGSTPAFRDVMDAYVPNRGLWMCPSDIGETFPGMGGGFGHRTPPFSTAQMGRTSYAFSGSGSPVKAADLAGKSLTYVRKPALTSMLWEIRPWHSGYSFAETDILRSPDLFLVEYCDGHVDRQTWANLLKDRGDAFR
jgi:prepilin-type N-terminal cleavage/methylation domain-containing protein